LEVLQMVRISKEPDERKGELLEMAERLFIEKGFEAVRVSDIVQALGVAQGTFYYYFPSKEEVLLALLDRKWSQIAAFIEQQVHGIADPVARLSATLRWMLMPGGDVTHSSQYRLLLDPAVTGPFHPWLDRARAQNLLPVMERAVRFGMDAAVFSPLAHEAEAVKIVFLGINAYMHDLIISGSIVPALAAVCETVERVLGLPPGAINLNQ
jgi:AcrR family transcriptional regulator